MKAQKAWLSLILALAFAVTIIASPTVAWGQARIFEEVPQGLADFDSRTAVVPPTSQQLAMVSNLGASATWNQFGTPQSLINYGGYLATGLSGDPAMAARTWIAANAALFRLSGQGVANLELLRDAQMGGSNGHAVLFRQRFGALPATQDGLITVGIVNGNIAYVSSSSAGDGNVPGAPSLSPLDAWLKATADVGRSVSLTDISNVVGQDTWTVFTVAGFAQTQRSRLVAFPTPTSGVLSAYETIVLDARGGAPMAYKSFVDAQTGAILFRQNAVQQLFTTNTFSGTYSPTSCGVSGPFATPTPTPPSTSIQTIDVIAGDPILTNDILLNLRFGSSTGPVVGSSDVATSPEAIHYAPTGGVPPGNYFVEVCPSPSPLGPFVSPTTYTGTITFNDVASTQSPLTKTPKWKFFTANPPLDLSSTDTRIIGCWVKSLSGLSPADAECQFALANLASRAPWDFNVKTNTPTFTTKGNNANSAEAWVSPLTPGGTFQQGNDPNRRYVFNWTNVWQNSKCTEVGNVGVVGGNDILAAVTNLFSMHNRMHDFSYFLGFTEVNSNAQDSNFGNTDPSRENDPEIGNAQAGALSGGSPEFLGRDNANQITLNDGIPPISNMYLWEPIAAGFYPPCADGDFDMSVIGHEYTHLISNRMVAGPDQGLSGYQAGSMGESWSDLDAVEYLNEYGFVPTNGENPFSVGAYVTGNKERGIRDYPLNNNPLNYSDLGFDTPGPEVHADGEVWNGTNLDIRQALIAKYNASFPATNAQLQRDCADGKLPAANCPGNRRWIQIVYDAWLLMQASPSMLDARDAYLAADVMRFGGANQVELWRAFAHRGMGKGAFSNGTKDDQPTPSFESPTESNATITLNAVALNEGNIPVKASIFVGKYEARVTPIADTDPATPLPNTAKFVPGTYDFIAQAPGYGHFRFTRSFTAGQVATLTIGMPTNWASKSKGATATATSNLSGNSSEALNAIDDTESTDWSGTGQTTTPQFITIAFAGAKTISQVNVSAMLSSQNRFTALRKFQIKTCNAATTNCSLDSNFITVLTSADNAFPGTVPRPVAPDLILRSFTLPSPVTATHLRLVALKNQCQGAAEYSGTNNPSHDPDPNYNSDCVAGSPTQASRIRVAEVQAFSSTGSATGGGGGGTGGGGGGGAGGGTGCQDDDLRLFGPTTAAPGSLVQFMITYSTGISDDNGCELDDLLPDDLSFVSATGGVYNASTRTVSWNLSAPAGTIGNVSFTAQVSPAAAIGEVLENRATFAGLALSPTALLDTIVLP